eukprot:scaffold14247_cov140-Isochrysis_galbana.AAC.7
MQAERERSSQGVVGRRLPGRPRRDSGTGWEVRRAPSRARHGTGGATCIAYALGMGRASVEPLCSPWRMAASRLRRRPARHRRLRGELAHSLVESEKPSDDAGNNGGDGSTCADHHCPAFLHAPVLCEDAQRGEQHLYGVRVGAAPRLRQAIARGLALHAPSFGAMGLRNDSPAGDAMTWFAPQPPVKAAQRLATV